MKHHFSYKHVDDSIAKINKEEYLQIAAEVAKKSPMMHKHGCVIVYKKQIIATGYNTMPTMFERSIHAEIHALNKVKNKQYLLKDSDLYIVRIGTNSFDNVLKYSKPCDHCTRCINQFKIRKVYYSTNYEFDTFVEKNSRHLRYDMTSICQNQICGLCY
jgi:deoxycytidylate deaminase